MTKYDYLKLGASLYVPATRPDILAIANNEKLTQLKSVIFCLEDSVLESDLPEALANIALMLRNLVAKPNKLRFIRVRDVAVLEQCLQMPDIDKIDGFVLPKVTLASFKEYVAALPADSAFTLMPTLETREALDMVEMTALREFILEQGLLPRVLSIRIGGNDLLNLFCLRRSTTRTMYDSPLRLIISQLVACFRPYGFNLTSPVCELLFERDILNAEVILDLEHGLFGKTAVHPDQIALIEQHYRVDANQLASAREILSHTAAAVFQRDGAMCEPATHRNWAEALLARAEIYGVHGERPLALAA
jgi:citrate lyase beta subunit